MNSLDKQAVLRVYGRYAPVYDWVFGRVLEPGRIAMTRAVVDRAPETLLEVGVGTGLALPNYPRATHSVGIDLSVEMLRRAQELVRRRALSDVELICADAEQLPFGDAAFDCVTVPYVLSVTPHPELLLSELRRVCRPDGRVFILGHFGGAGVWQPVERLASRLADRIGFRTDVSVGILEHPDWQIVGVRAVNLLGLSRLVELRRR
jgi:phosphatidylethanolamine/phosphatidyl-N-methylethanolamine N-methyltransferase